jgi:hypothetical protein
MRSGLVLAASEGVRQASFPVEPPCAGGTRILYYPCARRGSRAIRVYAPPGYIPDRAYPAAYLLHHSLAEPALTIAWRRAATTMDSLIMRGLARPTILASPVPPARRAGAALGGDDDGLPAMHVLLQEVLPFLERTYRIEAGEPAAIAVVATHPRDAIARIGPSCDVFTDPELHDGLSETHARFFRRLFWWTRQFRPRLDLRLVGVTLPEDDPAAGGAASARWPDSRLVERHYL